MIGGRRRYEAKSKVKWACPNVVRVDFLGNVEAPRCPACDRNPAQRLILFVAGHPVLRAGADANYTGLWSERPPI